MQVMGNSGTPPSQVVLQSHEGDVSRREAQCTYQGESVCRWHMWVLEIWGSVCHMARYNNAGR